MELSDELEGEHPGEIKIDGKGRFIIPKSVYDLLYNFGQKPFFLTEYDWENKEFHLRTPKNYNQESEKFQESENEFRNFCSRHFSVIIRQGRRINLSQPIGPDYCKLIHKETERPEIEDKSAKISWKHGYLVLKLIQ